MSEAVVPEVISTGVAGLDAILGGGLPRNRAFLIEGDPGCGKTTLALQFLMAGRDAGERTLYLTLSETAVELESVARSHGWNLDGIEIYEPPLDENPILQNEENTLFHPSEVELGELVGALIAAIDRVQPDRLVLDSLSEIRLLSQNHLRYRRQVLALKQYFLTRKMTVVLLDEMTRSRDMAVQSVPSGVIELEQTTPVYGSAHRRMRVMKVRGMQFHSGFHDFRILQGGVVVYPRLTAAHTRGEEQATDERLPSGIAAADQMLGGGLDRGTSTLLMGPAGTGKSSLATQYARAAAAREERTLVLTFDETAATFIRRSRDLGTDITEYVESGMIELVQVDPAQFSPGEFVCLVRSAVEERNARLVILDSINGFLSAMPEENNLILHLHELLMFLAQQSVTTILISSQRGVIGTGVESVLDITYLADAVILMRYFEADGLVRKALSILKKRSGPHETAIRELLIDSQGIRIGEPIRAFSGVLAGMPVFDGDQELLRSRDAGATESH